MNNTSKMNYVFTIQNSCAGCNKCIFKCPTNAHQAVLDNNQNKVLIKEGFCISCGECISICDHKARGYIDDTDSFFNDIKNGEQISVIIAPSAKTNFKNLNNIIGYLKSIGVNSVYDVSFGADICTWAHLKFIENEKPISMISQPCPVVVSYIEKYRPNLIKYLSPVQSPVICTSTYLKKYIKTTDKIMLLSPCIGKKREVSDEISGGTLNYNVTFSKFLEYIDKNDINLDNYTASNFDNVEGSIGFAFPRPGGLSENIKYHLNDDVWIKSIEGISNIESYFNEYINDLENNNPVPLIIDALSCIDGCSLGTGTNKDASHNSIDYVTNKLLKNTSFENSLKLTNYFNETLNLDDFKREYFDKSHHYKLDEITNLENTYIELGKFTEEERNINCFSCGYGSCRDFVIAMANGHNHKDNCKDYLLSKFRSLSYIDDLTGVKNRNKYSDDLAELALFHPGTVGVLFADINGLKEANDMFGHNFGDKIIKLCSDLLKLHFAGDVYRVGGDEFIILSSLKNKEAFDDKIEALKASLLKEETLAISIGSGISYSADDLKDAIATADQNMYIDKNNYYKKYKRADRRLSRE